MNGCPASEHCSHLTCYTSLGRGQRKLLRLTVWRPSVLFSPLFISTLHGCMKNSCSMFSSPLESNLTSPILIMGDILLLPPPGEPWSCEGLQEGRESWRDTAHCGALHPDFLLSSVLLHQQRVTGRTVSSPPDKASGSLGNLCSPP